MGNKVYTSIEDRPIEGCFGGLKKIRKVTKKVSFSGLTEEVEFYEWTFHNENFAIRAARVFANCNFSFVFRK
jgi:hypothetical protein